LKREGKASAEIRFQLTEWGSKKKKGVAKWKGKTIDTSNIKEGRWKQGWDSGVKILKVDQLVNGGTKGKVKKGKGLWFEQK